MNQSNLVAPPRNRALRRIVVRVACFVSTALICASVASAQVPDERARSRVPSDPRIAPDVVEQLRARPDVEIAAVGRHGTPSVLRGRLGRVNKPTASIRAADLAPVIADLAPVFRLRPADLESEKEWSDRLGHRHVRFRQRKHGLEVVGSSLSFHVDQTGVVYGAFGNARDDKQLPAPREARQRGQDAQATALAERGGAAFQAGRPRLVYLISTRDQSLHLSWEVRVSGHTASGPVDDLVFVDAISGAVVDRHPKIYHEAFCREVHHTVRYQDTIDINNESFPFYALAEEAYENDCETIPSPQYPNDSEADYHFDLLGDIHSYFDSVHGRDSWDDMGGAVNSEVNVHYEGIATAYWAGGGIMSFGTERWKLVYQYPSGTYADRPVGEIVFNSMATDEDIVVHEFSHGITETESGLIYAHEPGALNEAFSDIMAASFAWSRLSTQQQAQSPLPESVWKFGEACFTPSINGDALRYMAAPTEDKDFFLTLGHEEEDGDFSRDF